MTSSSSRPRSRLALGFVSPARAGWSLRLFGASCVAVLALACSAGGGADVVASANAGAGGDGGSSGDGGENLGGASAAGEAGQAGKGQGKAGSTAGGGEAGSGSIADEDCELDTGDGWPAASRTLECQVLGLMNEQRAAGVDCGGTAMPPVGPLKMHTALRQAARDHATDMAETGTFSHTSSDGKSTPERLKAAGYDGATYGENIANGQGTAQAVLTSWLVSAAQCKVLMNADYDDLGVGLARNTADETYWVADLASK
jgi:uncharacterized protein YkwD